MNKVIRWLAPTCFLLLWAMPAMGQIYGTGAAAFVPQTDASAIVVDGVKGEDEPWDSGLTLDLTSNWAGGWNEGKAPTPDIVANANLLYADDTLYVFVTFEDYELFFSDEWNSDQILIGVDPQHDASFDVEGGWEGWPWHGADSIHAFRVWEPGFTIRGDSVITDAVDWLNGDFVIDDELQTITAEAAIYVPDLRAGSQIGFNVGGSAATGELETAEYAWFAWQEGESAGGEILNLPAAYGTLVMLGEGELPYGTGQGALMPRVSPSAISVDGVKGEDEPWDDGLTLDLTSNWAGGWNEGKAPEPDIVANANLLYSDDTLYVFVTFEDYELFFSDEWNSDQILIGVDPQHDASFDVEGGWEGWPWHGADSIHAFRVWEPGFTIRGDSIITDAVDWLNGDFVIDDEMQTITAEAAIFVPGLTTGSEIGFNVGGSAATGELETAEYAWFAWQEGESAGGEILNLPAAYGTLIATSVVVTGVEEDYAAELPERFALKQNYPNPFNPSTTIEYDLRQAGQVTLQVFDLLGRHVATLVDDTRPAGVHTVRWEASGLASGMYVYQLRLDNDVVGSRIMMMVK